MAILLKNETGRKRGERLRYEYGREIFGHFYLDILKSRKHYSRRIQSLLFKEKRDFIQTLDIDLSRREGQHYFLSSLESSPFGSTENLGETSPDRK